MSYGTRHVPYDIHGEETGKRRGYAICCTSTPIFQTYSIINPFAYHSFINCTDIRSKPDERASGASTGDQLNNSLNYNEFRPNMIISLLLSLARSTLFFKQGRNGKQFQMMDSIGFGDASVGPLHE
jgi:hypothetical protein